MKYAAATGNELNQANLVFHFRATHWIMPDAVNRSTRISIEYTTRKPANSQRFSGLVKLKPPAQTLVSKRLIRTNVYSSRGIAVRRVVRTCEGSTGAVLVDTCDVWDSGLRPDEIMAS